VLHTAIDLIFSPHVDNIVAKASLRAKLMLSVTRSCITYQGFFCVFVRPILEFSSVICNPLLKQDTVKVESVQRRFTKRLKGLHNLPYTTRLSNLGLDSLHCRRTKADLSMCYKIISNHACTQFASSFTFSLSSKTRGNSRKLDKFQILTVRDGHSFAKCIINRPTWNSLPDSIVLSSSVATFRHKVNKLHFSDYCDN